MDEFTNTLDKNKFRSTNELWNVLTLNTPWSVGYVSTLIETYPFTKKEEWESFYYSSGEERGQELKKYPQNIVTTLNDCLLIYKDKNKVDNLSWAVKNINFNYGRTKEELAEKGAILFEELEQRGNKARVSLDDAIGCVRYRTICETWNGIIIRERNTATKLRGVLPLFEIRKVTGEIDFKYAIDYEILKEGNVICGIQIKPPSYRRISTFLLKAKKANEKKNAEYTIKYGVEIFNIYSKTSGEILNKEIIEIIKSI